MTICKSPQSSAQGMEQTLIQLKRSNMAKKTALDFINISTVSEHLTGAKKNIIRGRIPEKYKQQISDLEKVVGYWVTENEQKPKC